MARKRSNKAVRDALMAGIAIGDFSGGLDNGSDSAYLPLGRARSMNHCAIQYGSLRRADGMQRILHTDASIRTLMKFYPGLARGTLLYATDRGVFMRREDGTSQTILSAAESGIYDYIGYQVGDTDILIMTNGQGPMRKWDGTTLSPISAAPKAVAIQLHRERVWVIPADNPIAVQCSDDLNPENWDLTLEAGALILLPTWDGTRNTGLKVAFDDILVTKERSIWKIWGTDPSNYQVSPVFNGRGALANRSLVMCDNVMPFLSGDAVMVYDGVHAQSLHSHRIEGYLKRINSAYVKDAAATYYNQTYYLAVPLDASSVNNVVLMYHFPTQAWSAREGVVVNDFLEMDGALYTCDDAGNIYAFDTGDTLDGFPIPAMWQSGVLGAQEPELVMDLRKIRATLSGTEGGKLAVYYKLDGAREHCTYLPLHAQLCTVEVPIWGRGRLLELRIENVAGADFNLVMLQVRYFALQR
nr:hypothetical protein [Maliibacterium massiliense]